MCSHAGAILLPRQVCLAAVAPDATDTGAELKCCPAGGWVCPLHQPSLLKNGLVSRVVLMRPIACTALFSCMGFFVAQLCCWRIETLLDPCCGILCSTCCHESVADTDHQLCAAPHNVCRGPVCCTPTTCAPRCCGALMILLGVAASNRHAPVAPFCASAAVTHCTLMDSKGQACLADLRIPDQAHLQLAHVFSLLKASSGLLP